MESFSVYCSEPNAYLFYFDAVAEIKNADNTNDHRQLGMEHFLPRGSILRNSGSGIFAMTVYTGPDTKLIKNQGKFKYKKSNTEQTMNKIYII